jgi:hypothetical protein
MRWPGTQAVRIHELDRTPSNRFISLEIGETETEFIKISAKSVDFRATVLSHNVPLVLMDGNNFCP